MQRASIMQKFASAILLMFISLFTYAQEITTDGQDYWAVNRKGTAGWIVGGLTLQAIGVGGIIWSINLLDEYPADEDDETSIPGIIGATSAGIFLAGTGMVIHGFKIIARSRKSMREIRKNKDIPNENWGIQISKDGIGLVYRF